MRLGQSAVGIGFPFGRGDIVARLDRVEPVGQVLWAESEQCLVVQSQHARDQPQTDQPRSVWWEDQKLVLISMRNSPNLRLVAEAIDIAADTLPQWDKGFRYELVAFLSSGSVTSRAAADYVAKMPLGTLAIALERLQQTRCSASYAVDQVLGINFKFLSRSPGPASL